MMSLPDQNDEIRIRQDVLGAPIDVLRWPQATRRIIDWATRQESRIVCLCNVHSIVTTIRDENFASIIRTCDMATADGAPVAFLVRRSGHKHQERIDGPELMLRCCSLAAKRG